jgi:hypothetical protein
MDNHLPMRYLPNEYGKGLGCVGKGDAALNLAEIVVRPVRSSDYLVIERKAHSPFTVKANQPGVLQDLELYFQDRGTPHCVEQMSPDHGRIETRKIWTPTELNHYLDFPHVGQAFVIERHSLEKKSGESSLDIAYGITRKTPEQANPQQLLRVNR